MRSSDGRRTLPWTQIPVVRRGRIHDLSAAGFAGHAIPTARVVDCAAPQNRPNESDFMNEADIQRQKEIKEAEELLFTGAQALGFAKGLFLGQFVSDWAMPYPRVPAAQQTELDQSLAEVRQFLDEHLNATEIDRTEDIPRHVIDGLAHTGVLGMTAPKEFGGRGFTQMAYCKVLEEIGARDAATSVFTNAHHSIGIRALLLFGTREQKQKWLPALVRGEQLAAFALTEEEAGSDAANVQTKAVPSEDGSHYILNGEKRYITNASIAQVLTVMARTPIPGSRQDCDHRFPRHARHAGIHHARAADAEARNSRDGHGAFRDAEHGGAKGEYPWAVRQRIARRAHGVGLRAHDLRGLLHRRGQNVSAAGRGTRQQAQTIQEDSRRIRSGEEKDRAHGGRRLRDGSDDA